MSTAIGFPSAAMKALGLHICVFFYYNNAAKSVQTAEGQRISIIPPLFWTAVSRTSQNQKHNICFQAVFYKWFKEDCVNIL